MPKINVAGQFLIAEKVFMDPYLFTKYFVVLFSHITENSNIFILKHFFIMVCKQDRNFANNLKGKPSRHFDSLSFCPTNKMILQMDLCGIVVSKNCMICLRMLKNEWVIGHWRWYTNEVYFEFMCNCVNLITADLLIIVTLITNRWQQLTLEKVF